MNLLIQYECIVDGVNSPKSSHYIVENDDKLILYI